MTASARAPSSTAPGARSPSSMARELGRWLTAWRAGYGAVLLLAPGRVLSSLARQPCDRPTMLVARVLGLRELAQAGVLRSHPGRDWQLAGAGVDALHGASMLALATVGGRRYRKLAVANARTAGLLALTCLVQAWGAPCG